MLEAVRVDFIEMVMCKQKKKKRFKERIDPYGYMGESFRQIDPEAESWTELRGYCRGGKQLSSILLGLATRPAD